MDTHITHLSSAPPYVDAVSRPRATLPGEAPAPQAADPPDPAGPDAPPADPVPPTAAKPRRRGRTMLLASAAVLVVAAAGGAFLLSPYNHVVPVDTGGLEARARQLAASVGVEVPPVVAPAAKLATAPRPGTQPVYRDPVPASTADEMAAEIRGLRRGGAPQPAGAGVGEGRPGAAEVGTATAATSIPPSTPAGSLAAVTGSSASPPAVQLAAPALPLPPPAPPPPPAPAPAPTPALEVGLAAPASGQAQAAAPASAPALVEPSSPAAAADTFQAASTGRLASPVALALSRPAPASTPADPAAVAAGLRPAPMARGEQIEVLNLVAQLGVMVRDLRTENAALRAGVKTSAEKVDAAVADFERRLALAEARGAINAAMGADPGAAPPLSAGPAPSPAARTAQLSPPTPTPPAVQTVDVRVQVPAAATPATPNAGPRRYKVQAASPGLAMLSELDRSGGEGSQLQVGVGDQVPGYGKIIAIQQQGAAWVVKTDRGTIQ